MRVSDFDFELPEELIAQHPPRQRGESRLLVLDRRSGAIQPGDLPPECRTVSRRLLSPLEAMERDAIVRSLTDWDGNKIKAATALGMSRATIYRKIHEYGIVASTK